MHVLLRRYRIRSGAIEAVERRARQSLLRELREVPGFHSYFLVNEGGGTVTNIVLFSTAEGAATGDKLCDDWFRADWPTFRAVTPEPTVGELLVADTPKADAAAGEGAGPVLERRTGAERRWHAERRRQNDRRAGGEAGGALSA